jgi:hypothetical protein
MKSYEFPLGPSKRKITLQKNPCLFGIKLHSGTSIEAIQEQLGDELKVYHVGTLGGFQILQIDSQSVDQVIDKICKKDRLVQTTHIYNTPIGETPYVATGQIYVKFKEGTSTKKCLEMLEKYNLTKDKSRSELTFVSQVTDAESNPLKVVTQLQNETCIELVEPDLATYIKKMTV